MPTARIYIILFHGSENELKNFFSFFLNTHLSSPWYFVCVTSRYFVATLYFIFVKLKVLYITIIIRGKKSFAIYNMLLLSKILYIFDILVTQGLYIAAFEQQNLNRGVLGWGVRFGFQ